MDFDSRLLVKFLIEELSSDELRMLMEWRDRSNENEKIFSSFLQLRISHRYLHHNSLDKTEHALQQINKKIDKKRTAYWLPRVLQYAALFFLLLTLSYGGWQYMQKPESYTSIVVREGEEIKRISLADGTTVWLNRGTTLRIPDSFSARNRHVTIAGEAYFDVKKNPESPFLVEANELNVKVLGTSFNLNTSTEGDRVETILVSGRIALEDKNRRTLLEMSPGEKVSFSPSANEYTVETVDTNICTAWHLDQLKFERVALRDIANKLSILHDISVNIESKELAERKFRCVINRNEDLPSVLNHIKYMASIDYRIEGREVFIYKQKKECL